jgi:DTW domain-containing protein YfiP
MDTENGLKLNLCLTCRRRLLTCVCQYLRPFETKSRFVILMHPMEFKKEKVGTGRFSHLILKNSEIIVDVGFDENKRFLEVLKDENYQTVILYPGDETVDLSKPEAAQKLGTKPLQFIVIDGTWPCAKKMMKLTTKLHRLPRVSFDTLRISEFQVKHQPMPGCLSTVESLHQVLLDLNKLGKESTQGSEENLMEVFRQTVKLQIELAQDPARQGYRKKPFKLSGERKISKKWEHRLLFFRESEE